jgi:hypothetical protein
LWNCFNVNSEQCYKYLLARLSTRKAREAEATQPKGMCCMDYWTQWIRFVSLGLFNTFFSIGPEHPFIFLSREHYRVLLHSVFLLFVMFVLFIISWSPNLTVLFKLTWSTGYYCTVMVIFHVFSGLYFVSFLMKTLN